MTNWIVAVTKSYERPRQTRESRKSLSPIEIGLYDANATFTTITEAEEYATMAALAGNTAKIYNPEQWAQKQILVNASLEELQSWATLVSQYIWTIETTKANSSVLPQSYQRLADIKEEIKTKQK